MADLDYEDRTRAPDNGGVRQKAGAALDTAGSAARDTAVTAKDQAGQVAAEARSQARNLAHDVRDRVGTEARNQNDRLAESVRRFADELDEMAGQRGDSPASKVVTQVSQGGRRVADYLAEHGPDGVLEGVQDFARRRPGTFLLAAAAAGFVVGRLGKGVLSAGSSDDDTAVRAPSTAGLDDDTVRLTPPPVPVTPQAETPQTVGTSTTYAGSPAAASGGLATEPIPDPASLRP